MTLGQEVTGNLTNPGDEATYTFTGAPGQRVGFNRIGSNSKLSLQLTDPFGGLVFSQGTNLGIAGPYTLAWAGTYTLTLAGSGPYDFVLDDAAMATPIALGTGTGTTTSGTLATGLSTRLYQFSGLAGEVVYFQGQQDSSSLASVAELYGPTGGFLTDFYLERQRQVTLPSTGTYLLAVAGQGTVAGAVTYRFEAFENVEPVRDLATGPGGNRLNHQSRRRGDLHVHRNPRPACLPQPTRHERPHRSAHRPLRRFRLLAVSVRRQCRTRDPILAGDLHPDRCRLLRFQRLV